MKSYLSFTETHNTGKTKVFSINIVGGDSKLGQIKWYAPWRKYCFYPTAYTIFDKGCLNEIVSFIDQLMEDRK